ncbi:PAS domain-containing sensor histidine kinase [Actinoplanes missouriensis]|uniref:PAS domain-containing sensor histidine kinase n=1 Tax=Actinoplanes missouriensis TaxID=1866 RepID=UPI0033FEAF32
MGRLSRLIAGCAGITVAVLGALDTRTLDDGVPPEGLLPTPAVALVPAGIALFVQVIPAPGGRARRIRTVLVALLALAAAALAAAGAGDLPAATAAALPAALIAGTILFRAPDDTAAPANSTTEPAPANTPADVAASAPAGPAEVRDRDDFAHSLLQSMNEAVMVLDANYRVIDVNRRWRELTGYPDDDVARDPPPLPPPGSGGDWTIPRVDGTAVPVLATMAAIPDAAGTTLGYVATCVDIAERKHAEEALTEHAAELERGNAQLAAALAFKNDLTSMLTHDVAQPISSIASLAELLSADWADLPDDVRLELATKIDKNTRRLVKMMNDLQLLFRLDTGSVTTRRAPVPLLEVVRTVGAAMVGDRGVEIAIDEDLTALADRGHLTVVVENLLKNALTHGSPPVLVKADRYADSVLLVVQDSGPGIPDDVLPGIFGRFIRGAGLGLFIVRHLVEANGGSVRYEHATPQGARLLVTLERAPA